MVWVWSIGGGMAGLFVLFIFTGLLHARHSKRQALNEVRRIELAEIEALANECVDVFQRKLDVRLDLNDCDDTTQKLDNAFRDIFKLKGAFARDDFYWHFVKPVGACLGELLRRHASHEWIKQPDEAPTMRISLKEGFSDVFPFEKVINHAMGGDPSDLVAYVAFAQAIRGMEGDLTSS